MRSITVGKSKRAYEINMAACEDQSKFSDYFKGLDSTAKARYVEKLSYKDKGEVKPLPDPYSLKKWGI